jgi:hypothetical protein
VLGSGKKLGLRFDYFNRCESILSFFPRPWRALQEGLFAL